MPHRRLREARKPREHHVTAALVGVVPLGHLDVRPRGVLDEQPREMSSIPAVEVGEVVPAPGLADDLLPPPRAATKSAALWTISTLSSDSGSGRRGRTAGASGSPWASRSRPRSTAGPPAARSPDEAGPAGRGLPRSGSTERSRPATASPRTTRSSSPRSSPRSYPVSAIPTTRSPLDLGGGPRLQASMRLAEAPSTRLREVGAHHVERVDLLARVGQGSLWQCSAVRSRS